MTHRFCKLLVHTVIVLCMAIGAAARGAEQDLTIGLSAAITSLDPHFANNSPNKAVARHFFEALLKFDEKLEVVPALSPKAAR